MLLPRARQVRTASAAAGAQPVAKRAVGAKFKFPQLRGVGIIGQRIFVLRAYGVRSSKKMRRRKDSENSHIPSGRT